MILVGDCREVMATLAAGSVSSVICDPPYGLKFMGKGWDHGVPGVEFWVEALRVAAPGARLLAFGGTRTYHRLTCAIEDAGWRIEDCISWLYGSGFPKHKSKLKPAWEPIILAHKPTKGAVPLNIDECRLSGDGLHAVTQGLSTTIYGNGEGLRKERGQYAVPSGRWPANVVLDEEAAEALDAQSGERPAGIAMRGRSGGNTFGTDKPKPPMHDIGYGDFGGASRFYYTAKASRSEREGGLDGMPMHERSSEIGQLHEGVSAAGNKTGRYHPRRNAHPTVKPLDLMQWLCRLITPTGGVILDPFCGSGTTGCAALMEGFSFIGIDEDPEYAEIARKRLAHWGAQIAMPLIAEGA